MSDNGILDCRLRVGTTGTLYVQHNTVYAQDGWIPNGPPCQNFDAGEDKQTSLGCWDVRLGTPGRKGRPDFNLWFAHMFDPETGQHSLSIEALDKNGVILEKHDFCTSSPVHVLIPGLPKIGDLTIMFQKQTINDNPTFVIGVRNVQ
jgi:hypothetical protein